MSTPITAASLADAFASAEGFGAVGAVPTRANNPGDLSNGDIGFGTIQSGGGNHITIYPSLEAGKAALETQTAAILSGSSKYYDTSQSIADVGSVYSGGSTNWAQNVAKYLGVDPNSPIKSLLSKDSIGAAAVGIASHGLVDYIFIAVGLLLIAGGIFSFKQTQTVIQSAVKNGSKIAEVAA